MVGGVRLTMSGLCRCRHSTDNGSAFVDESLARTCARLGIRLTHSKPYRPQGRGKIERFFNTVTSQFLTEITTADTATGVVNLGSTGP